MSSFDSPPDPQAPSPAFAAPQSTPQPAAPISPRADGAVHFRLSNPVVVAGNTHTEFWIAKGRVKHLRAMDLVSGQQEKSVALAAAMCGVSFGVIDEMELDDFFALQRASSPQMGNAMRAMIEAEAAARRAGQSE